MHKLRQYLIFRWAYLKIILRRWYIRRVDKLTARMYYLSRACAVWCINTRLKYNLSTGIPIRNQVDTRYYRSEDRYYRE
jgi:hypothetical protein